MLQFPVKNNLNNFASELGNIQIIFPGRLKSKSHGEKTFFLNGPFAARFEYDVQLTLKLKIKLFGNSPWKTNHTLFENLFPLTL